MRRTVFWIVLGIVWVLGSLCSGTSAQEQTVLSRIAFGSCAQQGRPLPILDAIVETRPQVFLFLGDNIYADTEDMAVMRRKYAQLAAKPGYQRLKRTARILATWDDHDYGANDAGAEYPKKRESQRVFLEFFEEEPDSPRWKRPGVYRAWMFGPPQRRVQIILLDCRYFRSRPRRGKHPVEPGEGVLGPYVPNRDPNTTILGEAQWRWLEEQLRRPARLRIIGASIQVVPDEHGWECWGNFPHERKRLFDLIRKTKAQGVIIVSGDRHAAEVSRLPARTVGYPLYDVTSSALNQRLEWYNEINSYRVGLKYFEPNFGLLLIDWEKPDPVIRMQIRDVQGKVLIQVREPLSRLQLRP